MAATEVPDWLDDDEAAAEEEGEDAAAADARSCDGRDSTGGAPGAEPDAELAHRLAALRARYSNLYLELLADQPGASPEVLRRQLVRARRRRAVRQTQP